MSTYQSVLKSTRKGIGLSGGLLKLFATLMMTAYSFAVVIIKNGKLYACGAYNLGFPKMS